MELSKESGMIDLGVYRIIMIAVTSGLAMSFKVSLDHEKRCIVWGTPICKTWVSRGACARVQGRIDGEMEETQDEVGEGGLGTKTGGHFKVKKVISNVKCRQSFLWAKGTKWSIERSSVGGFLRPKLKEWEGNKDDNGLRDEVGGKLKEESKYTPAVKERKVKRIK